MKQHTTNHFFKSKQLLLAFCLLAIVNVSFWACRKQDYKADDLQIISTQLQTWLQANGGIYANGDLLVKDSKGQLTKATLNWGQ